MLVHRRCVHVCIRICGFRWPASDPCPMSSKAILHARSQCAATQAAASQHASHSMPASNTHHMRASTSCAWGRAPKPVCHVKQRHQQPGSGMGEEKSTARAQSQCFSLPLPTQRARRQQPLHHPLPRTRSETAHQLGPVYTLCWA